MLAFEGGVRRHFSQYLGLCVQAPHDPLLDGPAKEHLRGCLAAPGLVPQLHSEFDLLVDEHVVVIVGQARRLVKHM